MHSEKASLIALGGVLLTIIILAIIGTVAAAYGLAAETLGLAAAVTGLIGILGALAAARIKRMDKD